MHISTPQLLLIIGTACFALNGMAQTNENDGSKALPYTPEELAHVNSLIAQGLPGSDKLLGQAFYVKADFLGFGTDLRVHDAAAGDREDAVILGDTKYQWVGRSANIARGFLDATNRQGLLIKAIITRTEDGHVFNLQEVEGAMSVTIGATGYKGFWCEANYTIPDDRLYVVSASASAKSAGDFRYISRRTAETVVGRGSSGNILQGPAGTYPVTFTDAASNQGASSTSLSAGVQGTSAVRKNTTAYKFVATPERVGFVRGEGDGTTVQLDSKQEVYLRFNAATITALLGDAADTSFIPWKNTDGISITGITRHATTATPAHTIYDLNGRRAGQSPDGLPKGVYIVDGRKVMR